MGLCLQRIEGNLKAPACAILHINVSRVVVDILREGMGGNTNVKDWMADDMEGERGEVGREGGREERREGGREGGRAG